MELPNIWRDPTLDALDRLVESVGNNEGQRNYLGASSIGDECSRKLWYRLQGHTEYFDADSLRRFEDGHRTEDLICGWLKRLPFIELHTHKPDGGQYGFSDLGGQYQGHYDGVIRGLLQAPKTWHILEVKCVNDKKFAELEKLVAIDEKSALQKWDATYYAQAVTYMKYENLTRHYLICSTPGGRRLTSVRTNADNKYADALTIKAGRIIKSQEPPERIGTKDYFKCKWCAFKDMCHDAAS